MFRKLVSSKALWALFLPVIMVSAAHAGAGCAKSAVQTAGAGAHCPMLSKQIAKQGEVTENGAVVTLTGKTDQAVEHIKAHLMKHEKGEACTACPLTQDGITTTIEMNEKGGVITATASTPELVEMLHKWAKSPSACCQGGADKA
jgi:hypothetical protein